MKDALLKTRSSHGLSWLNRAPEGRNTSSEKKGHCMLSHCTVQVASRSALLLILNVPILEVADVGQRSSCFPAKVCVCLTKFEILVVKQLTFALQLVVLGFDRTDVQDGSREQARFGHSGARSPSAEAFLEHLEAVSQIIPTALFGFDAVPSDLVLALNESRVAESCHVRTAQVAGVLRLAEILVGITIGEAGLMADGRCS